MAGDAARLRKEIVEYLAEPGVASIPRLESFLRRAVEFLPDVQVYDPSIGDDMPCGNCSHPYYRHFDPYENMEPVGCKYCDCQKWVPYEY